MDTIRKSKTSLLSILGMLGIAAYISFAIDPPLDTELNDIPGDTHLGEWVQAISSNQVSESVYATNGNLVVNGMEYPVGGGGGSEEEIVALSNRVNAIENAGYVATNEHGMLSVIALSSDTYVGNVTFLGSIGVHNSLDIGIPGLYEGGLTVNGTNVMERIDEIAASSGGGGDLTPATNYVDAATNNLRSKTDMTVYGETNVWYSSYFFPHLFVAESAGVWTNGTDKALTWQSDNGGLWILLENYPDSPMSIAIIAGGRDLNVVDFQDYDYGTFSYYSLFPTADRLATTNTLTLATQGTTFSEWVITYPPSSWYPEGSLSLQWNASLSGWDCMWQGESQYQVSGAYDATNLVWEMDSTYTATRNLLPPFVYILNGQNDKKLPSISFLESQISSAISTNNPAFVDAVTNLIQNLPQDTLQALKAALNALP